MIKHKRFPKIGTILWDRNDREWGIIVNHSNKDFCQTYWASYDMFVSMTIEDIFSQKLKNNENRFEIYEI